MGKAGSLDLARWWREPPAAASPDVLRWVGGTFKAGAGASLLVATLAGLGPAKHAPFLLLIAAGALVNGGFVLVFGQLLARGYYHFASVVATVAISATLLLI